MNIQARAFCFTWNDEYTLLTEMDFPGCTHLVYQEELAPTTGMPHLQGYVKFAKRQRGTQVKACVQEYDNGGAFHIIVAAGSPQTNFAYCTKVDSRADPRAEPYVFGDFSAAGQGKRNDVISLRDAIKAGRTFTQLVDDDTIAPSVAANMRFTERCISELQLPKPRPNLHVTLCLGPPGAGKTYCASTRPADISDEDIYWKDDMEYWEGYSGQRMVVMDEFSGHTMPPLKFQRYADVYPVICNIKGRSHPYNAQYLRITSNYTPSGWWKEGTRYSQDAIYRRIHEVHYHPRIGEVFTYHSDDRADDEPSMGYMYAMEKFNHANHQWNK